MSNKKRFRAYISGSVQGVFFRWETKKLAKQLGINGTVSNLRDGRVEVIAEGEVKKLKELLNFLDHGPKYAQVSNIEIKWYPFIDEFSSFQISH